MQQLSARGKPEVNKVEEDESADISEELVSPEELTEKGSFKIKNTKRFLHNLQKQKH